MRKLFILFLILSFTSIQTLAAKPQKIQPEYLKSNQSTSYELVNETVGIIFNKLKPEIKTNKYPKYFHDFTLIKDDGTQSKNYKYVKKDNAELIYAVDTNELVYIAITRPELHKCRILYDYPSGKLHAVQIFVSASEYFIFGPDGKYIDYSEYVENIHKKVKQNWKVPSRKKIESIANGKKELYTQIAITVGKDGNLKKAIVLKSSKIKALDDNALTAIKHSSPFEPFPENFFNDEITITLNFNFNL